jgi:hypothetical protein
VHTNVKYYFVPTPTSVGNESNKFEMSTTANSLGAILNWLKTGCTQYVSNARCKNSYGFSFVSRLAARNTACKIQIPRDKKPRGEVDRFSLTLGAAWEETRQHIPKKLPPGHLWKFAGRYSIPSLVIVFTPRNGVGIENRASQWGEKPNVRVFQYRI